MSFPWHKLTGIAPEIDGSSPASPLHLSKKVSLHSFLSLAPSSLSDSLSSFLARKKNKTSETQGISTRAWVKIGIETAHRNSVSVSLTKVISDYYYYYTTLHFSPRCILAAIYACATRDSATCYLLSLTTQIMAAKETTSASPKMLLNTSLATVYVRDYG